MATIYMSAGQIIAATGIRHGKFAISFDARFNY